MTIGESLPAQLVRKSARKGFTFNIMAVGPSCIGKTSLLSALFGKNLEITRSDKCQTLSDQSAKRCPTTLSDPLNPPVTLESKTFEIDEKKVRLKLTVVESQSYGDALNTTGTHKPLVDYIESQFADYYKRESSHDRRNIQDRMVHCLFFFIAADGYGLSRLDLEFLRAIHNRVNIVPIIATAEALTASERASFKRRVRDDLEKNNIRIYELPDADPDDTDDMKRCIKEIQDASPFAVCRINRKPDNSIIERNLDWGQIDPCDRDHSDYLLLKTMLHMQMPDLQDSTHEIFYEEYRLRKEESARGSRSSSIVGGRL